MGQLIWLNGVVLDEDAARISSSDRGFAHGDGVFETLRVTDGVAWHLPLHLARLRQGAETLGIAVPWSDTELRSGCGAVAGAIPDAALRITLSRGPGPRGLLPPDPPNPTVLIAAWPCPASAAPERAIIAITTRRNEHSPLARIKSLNYLDSILARQEAALAGAGEAILRNTAGRLAEACAGNLFVRIAAGWFTPPVDDGALPGIARALILGAGLATERSLELGDLAGADAAFTSNSLALRPLSEIGAHRMALPDLAMFERAIRDHSLSGDDHERQKASGT